MGDDVDISTLIIEQYLALIQDNNRPGIVKPEIGNDVEFEINSNFMIRRKLFAGTDDEDSHEHVRRLLEIIDLFHFLGVTLDAVMLRVFPITLKGRALSPDNIDAIQESFKEAHPTKECPLKKEDKAVEQSKYMRSLEETIIKFYEESIKKLTTDDEWIRKSIENTDSNIRALRTTTKNLQEKAYQLTQTVLTDIGEKVKARTTMDKESVKEPIPRDLLVVQTYAPPTPFLGHFKGQIWSPYRTRKTVCMIENLGEVHKLKAQEVEGDMDFVQPYMPLGSVHDKEKFVRKEEQDYNIPLHDGVMQTLTPQTVHITPPDDDYVAHATSPTLDKQLNEFGEECSDITRVADKANGNPVKDVHELSDFKTYDCKTFIWKLLHQVPAARRQISRPTRHVIVW
ncbi:hypothetical protein Tco_1180080 [Tanacetum coccineum]